jgi:hypothetical protein
VIRDAHQNEDCSFRRQPKAADEAWAGNVGEQNFRSFFSVFPTGRLGSRLLTLQSSGDVAMMRRLPTGLLGMALRVYEGATAALWLLIGLGTVRTLVRLARMVPVRPAAEPKCRPSRNAEGSPQEARRQPARDQQ